MNRLIGLDLLVELGLVHPLGSEADKWPDKLGWESQTVSWFFNFVVSLIHGASYSTFLSRML